MTVGLRGDGMGRERGGGNRQTRGKGKLGLHGIVHIQGGKIGRHEASGLDGQGKCMHTIGERCSCEVLCTSFRVPNIVIKFSLCSRSDSFTTF